MLKEHSEGVIAASACLGGVYAGNYWENIEHGEDVVLDAMRETTQKMVEDQAGWATLIQTCAPGSTVLLVGSHADEVQGGEAVVVEGEEEGAEPWRRWLSVGECSANIAHRAAAARVVPQDSQGLLLAPVCLVR